MNNETGRTNAAEDVAIPMGGQATPAENTTPAAPAPYIPTKEEVEATAAKQPKKKKGKRIFLKIISGIFGVILLLLILLGVAFGLATIDDMPAAPTEYTSMSDVLTKAVTGLLSDTSRIEMNSTDLNGILKEVQPTLEKTLNEYDMSLSEAFIVMADSKATLYARVKYKNITLPVRATISLRFNEPSYAIIDIQKVSVGKLNIPDSLITSVLANVDLPEDVTLKGDFIYYDTSSINTMLLDAIRENETLTKTEDFLNKFLGFFGGGFSFEDTIDISFNDISVIDNQLVISVESILHNGEETK